MGGEGKSCVFSLFKKRLDNKREKHTSKRLYRGNTKPQKLLELAEGTDEISRRWMHISEVRYHRQAELFPVSVAQLSVQFCPAN